MSAAVYTAAEMAGLLGVSTWLVYQNPDAVVPPIHVGRRLVWPKAQVDRLLGLDATAEGDAAAPGRPSTGAETASSTRQANSTS